MEVKVLFPKEKQHLRSVLPFFFLRTFKLGGKMDVDSWVYFFCICMLLLSHQCVLYLHVRCTHLSFMY